MKPEFKAGNNIAMKVPPHEYAATVAFYRDIIGLQQTGSDNIESSACFEFGDKTLWIDRVAGISQAETWLQVTTADIDAAADYLQQQGVQRCDAIEALPDDFAGFWISSPCNIVHLVCDEQA